uniref:Uncharacterized protein n=1 Tax=Rhizophora mucronata TaxID=61149 RepID=A0A2P2J3I3_RHIMU
MSTGEGEPRPESGFVSGASHCINSSFLLCLSNKIL